jgi:hypothetical protein
MHAPRWRRLLDGGRTWGSLEISPTRYGVTHYNLVVFPPGISAEDRMLLRAWRFWPIWGTLTWLVLEVLLAPLVGVATALAISTGIWLAAGAVAMAMAGANRARVRTMTVVRIAGHDDPLAPERLATLRSLVEELCEADQRLAAGESTTVDHELAVWRVYDRLNAATSTVA